MDNFYASPFSAVTDILNFQFFFNPRTALPFSFGEYFRLIKDTIVNEFSTQRIVIDFEVVVLGLAINALERTIGRQTYALLKDPMNFGSQSTIKFVSFFVTI